MINININEILRNANKPRMKDITKEVDISPPTWDKEKFEAWVKAQKEKENKEIVKVDK